jgi:putative FmdB family regulatory protein
MPTYQYACTDCGHDFEQFQSFSDDALTTCPECSGKLRKLYNAVGVVFKGSGFYRTDSRGKSTEAGEKSGEKSGDKSGEKSGEKSTAPAASTSTSSDSSSSSSSSTPAATPA